MNARPGYKRRSLDSLIACVIIAGGCDPPDRLKGHALRIKYVKRGDQGKDCARIAK